MAAEPRTGRSLRSPTDDAEVDRLRGRVAALEAERRRAFEEAQREADALFAQYQLSQLVASGGRTADLAGAVLLELLRLADAAGGALWLGEDGTAARLAEAGDPPPTEPPATAEDAESIRSWSAAAPGCRVVVIAERAPRAIVALWPRTGADLDEDGLRVALLARHELAVAFQGARLREALEHEREELGAIVDGATDLIVQVDGEGRVVRLNPAAGRALGLGAGDAIGRTCTEVLGCEIAGGHAAGECPLAEVRRLGTPIAYRETAVRGADGRPMRVAGSYAATPAIVGREGRATAILRDIGAVRALEELREGFVATVSHELRTPLALIRGYAETLLHLDLDPVRQRTYVTRIDEASGRLTALVDEVLDVTHLQADPLILDRSRTTLTALIARLRGDLETAGGGDRLIIDLPDELPELEVDIVRVGQILSNLVANALKYAPAPTPVVLTARMAPEAGWLEVAVDDEGVGVPEEDRTLVTEPFHRAWNVRESRIPGTGLGLFICRRLVEAHGGGLTIHARPDGRPGTRVRFTLPIATGTRDDG